MIIAEGAFALEVVPRRESRYGLETLTWSEGPLGYTLSLLEGCEYEYRLSPNSLRLEGEVGAERLVRGGAFDPSTGTLTPGRHVGLVKLLVKSDEGKELGSVILEVRSAKLEYDRDYVQMLDDICGWAVDLLLQLPSPASIPLVPDPESDEATARQRFYFLRSVLSSTGFFEAVERIAESPHERTAATVQSRSLHRLGISGPRLGRELVSAQPRCELPKDHPMRLRGFDSVPRQVRLQQRDPSVDTHENRFVKHALEEMHHFLSGVEVALERDRKRNLSALGDISHTKDKLLVALSRPLFREVSSLSFVTLGSPVLQRRSGYRQVLRAWLEFQLGASLSWEGGDDVYLAGKKDVAALYEYWVFIRLARLVAKVFELDLDVASLLQPTKSGLGLGLRRGRATVLSGETVVDGTKLNIAFAFNRSFKGKPGDGSPTYPSEGSWSVTMRPDYCLSVWPSEVKPEEAEEDGTITHLHLDAKYRLSRLIRDEIESAEGELPEEAESTYQNSTVVRMHAYRDAIRRSVGAFVIYPGDLDASWRGYHELLPGVGAFPLRPALAEADEETIRSFLTSAAKVVADRDSELRRMRSALTGLLARPQADGDQELDLATE